LATALYMQASDASRSDGIDTSWLSGDRYWTSAYPPQSPGAVARGIDP
jgi:hypothetical protein